MTEPARPHGIVARIIDACAKHRVMVLLGVGIAAVAAWLSIQRTRVDAIPDLSEPQVIVFTGWPGRSPTLIEDQVTYPIVSGLVSSPQVKAVRGLSMFGMSFVYVLFDDDVDIDRARSRIAERLIALRERLPAGVEATLGPDASGIGWVFQYVIVADPASKLDLPGLRRLQDTDLRYAIGSVEGVAEVATVGGYERQYQVTVDPLALRSHGVTLLEVADAIGDSTGEVGGRVIEMTGREYYVRGLGQVAKKEDVESIVIAPHGPSGTPVRIADIGRVAEGPDERRGALDWNGEGEAVGGIVVIRTGENARDVIRRVKARIAEIEQRLPAGVHLEVAYDRSALIDRSIHTLRDALIEEAIAVALVIVLFLLHLRSAMVPVLSLPIAVALAFIPMHLLGIPSTIMSLGGIAIALGAAVDAEIVMVEACHKKLEHAPPGADRRALLAEAAREVTPAIFYSLLIVAVAFLPVFALTGQAARLFQPMAWTKTFVMAAAAVLSITLAPALRDLAIRGPVRPESRHPVSRAIIAVYRPFVYVALRRPWSTALIGAFALASAIPLSTKLGREFMPPLDEGDVLYMPMTLPGISIEQARQQLQHQDQILKSFPEVESVFGKIGRAESATDPAPLAMAETTIRLRPRSEWRKKHVDRWWSGWTPGFARGALRALWPDERPLTWNELTREMDAHMQFAGWTNAWTYPIKARIDMLTTGIRTPLGIKILGDKVEDIERAGLALEERLRGVAGASSVVYERSLGGLYLDVVPRRDELDRYGLTVGDVDRIVEMAIGGSPVATTIEGRARVTINVRYPQDLRTDVDTLRALPVPVGGEGMGWITLGEIADVSVSQGPPMVRDEAGKRAGYLYITIDDDKVDVGGWIDAAQRELDAMRARGEIPAGVELQWAGQYEQLREMRANMKLAIPAALLIILFLLWLQFRSAAEVAIIVLSIPFALVGSVWLMYLLDYRVSTAVWVGVIALIGLATQTGVVMILYIDNAYHRRKAAGAIEDLDDIIRAHAEGSVLRVRPKLMTVTTMAVGLVPLLWADGSGSDVMKRVAAPMVGGLATSALLTLEILPVIYTYWRWDQLLMERLVAVDPARRRRLLGLAYASCAGFGLAAAAVVAPIYVAGPFFPIAIAGAVVGLAAFLVYYVARRPAQRLIWPRKEATV